MMRRSRPPGTAGLFRGLPAFGDDAFPLGEQISIHAAGAQAVEISGAETDQRDRRGGVRRLAEVLGVRIADRLRRAVGLAADYALAQEQHSAGVLPAWDKPVRLWAHVQQRDAVI